MQRNHKGCTPVETDKIVQQFEVENAESEIESSGSTRLMSKKHFF